MCKDPRPSPVDTPLAPTPPIDPSPTRRTSASRRPQPGRMDRAPRHGSNQSMSRAGRHETPVGRLTLSNSPGLLSVGSCCRERPSGDDGHADLVRKAEPPPAEGLPPSHHRRIRGRLNGHAGILGFRPLVTVIPMPSRQAPGCVERSRLHRFPAPSVPFEVLSTELPVAATEARESSTDRSRNVSARQDKESGRSRRFPQGDEHKPLICFSMRGLC